jgi:hypothetical protein
MNDGRPSPFRHVAVIAAMLIAVTATGATGDLPWSDAQPFNTNAATDGSVSDYYCHLARDGTGHWVCVWCAAVPASSDRDFDIFVATSDDAGESWSDPARLDPAAVDPPEIEDDFHPFVVTDGDGHWVATWYTHDNHGGTIGDDTDILVSRSTDNGVTWTSSAPLNSDATTDTTGDSTPSIATDGAGLWVAVWNKKVTEDSDYDLYTAHSTDHGESWSDLTLLHESMDSDIGYDGAPSITTDGDGHWVVVWMSEDPLDGTLDIDDDIFVATSTDGLTWSTPSPLNSDAAVPDQLDDKSPRIITDGAGRWLTVWYYGVFEVDYDVKFSVSDDNGETWSPVRYLNTNALTDGGRDLYPVPSTDGRGTWVVVWQSKEPIFPFVGTDYDILFSYSVDNGAHWSPPWFLNSFAPELLDGAYDRDPEVLYAGNGTWRTVWGSQYDLDYAIGPDYDLMIATATLVPDGDHDADGDVDVYDFGAFQACFAPDGPLRTGCLVFDADQNDAVDLDDFVFFESELIGPG